MIDTHCHLTYDGLAERVDDVVAAAKDAGVDRMISVGTTPDDAQRALALTRIHEGVYATAGLHPHYTAGFDDRDALLDALRELIGRDRVVALGEMGLDWHYPDPPRDTQRRAFAWQLELAGELPDVPIIIHNREATDDTLAMIREAGVPGERFVFHCFTGTLTFSSAKDIAEASDFLPIERIMV